MAGQAGDDKMADQAGDDKMADQASHDELKFVLHITDDFAVEKVHYSLCAGCVLL